MKYANYLIEVLFIIFLVFILIGICVLFNDCNKKGGVLVNYQCIKAERL